MSVPRTRSIDHVWGSALPRFTASWLLSGAAGGSHSKLLGRSALIDTLLALPPCLAYQSNGRLPCSVTLQRPIYGITDILPSVSVCVLLLWQTIWQKQFKERALCLGSQFKGPVFSLRKGHWMGAWGDCSHCVCSQETERIKKWMLMFDSLILFGPGPRPLVRSHSRERWILTLQLTESGQVHTRQLT